MKTLTRYDPLPFTELTRFEPMWDVNDLLSRFMLRPHFRSDMEMEPQIRMDVKEAGKGYMLTAEIPGVKKEDIHVTIEGRQVSISAELKHEKDVEEGERLIRSERVYGMASRTFTLPEDIDQGKVVAKYADGVLELTMPWKAGTAHKEVPIM